MKLSAKDYYNKTMGCWLGKTIGGTLGEPMEWRRQKNDVSFYWQKLDGSPRPNDDLDIQLIWLNALEEYGIDIDSKLLGEFWTLYNDAHWSEYGNAKVNLKAGLMPPLSGTMHNVFKDSDGSFIRSEIWAAISPGEPAIAAKYAYEDGIVDHGDGEGTYAEVFAATMEAAAYLVSDIDKLVEIGLSYIPKECAVSKAVRNMIDDYKSGMSLDDMRMDILNKYRGEVYWGRQDAISESDRELGLAEGKPGFDVPVNMAFTVAGLYYGEGDFEKTLCINAQLGEDTDCTCATAGSLFGIMWGVDKIPERWIKPIGYGITTLCCNLADMLCAGLTIPVTVQELTERTYNLAKQVLLRNQSMTQITETEETSLTYDIPEWMGRKNFVHVTYVDMSKNGKAFDPDALICPDNGASIFANIGGPVYKNFQLEVGVNYGEEGAAVIGNEKTIKINFYNAKRDLPEYANFTWYLPDPEWSVSPAKTGRIFMTPSLLHTPRVEKEFTFTIPEMDSMERAVLEITFDGRSFVQLVPVIFTKEV